MSETPPILEYDPSPRAIVKPQTKFEGRAPARAVLCFFQEVLQKLLAEGQLRIVGHLVYEIGRNPIYELEWQGGRLLVLHPGVGAPLAAGFLEELISLGVQKVIVCGGCGVLDRVIAAGRLVVLRSAVRDEGTSYHYLPPAREVEASPQAVMALEETLRRRGLPYLVGKSWTTDGLYRETEMRRLRRGMEGCLVVEMEAAALFAVAQFRKITLGQIVYGGDLVVPEGWDERAWFERKSDRELLFWLAVEACAGL